MLTRTAAGPSTARYVTQVMGMPISLALRGRHIDDAAAQTAWIKVVAGLREVDLIFSTYRPDSLISRLGRKEITVSDCPPEVHEVLALGAAAEQDSFGAFSVYRPSPVGQTLLDPSGVVKGWAVERFSMILRDLQETDFSLSAGGDLVCGTARTDAEPWRIGIEDPHDPTRIIAVVPVSNGAVATSGATHRGAHVVDARTGQSPTRVASVTVIAGSLTRADIDATAAFALGPDAADWLRTRPDCTGLVVWDDGSTIIVGA
jgi:thiamine biosynthesis lipoprotein